MPISELISEALDALWANIMRTILTMLGIIIGIASVILIISLGQGATASITEEISAFGTNMIMINPGARRFGPARGAGLVSTLKYEDSKAIAKENIPGLAAVSGQVGKRAQIIADAENVNATVIGVESTYQEIQSLELTRGSFIDDEQVSTLARVAVVGPEIVKELFGEGTDPLGAVIKIDGKPFRVIGVTQAKGSGGFSNPDESVFIPITTTLKLILGQNHVEGIFVSAENVRDIKPIIKRLKTLLTERHRIKDPALVDFNVGSAQEAISIMGNVTGILTALLTSVAAVSLVVGGIGIMNIMLVTVTERTREIGLLKAVGARRRDILRQFLLEAVVLTLSGGLIGMTIGIILTYLISSAIDLPFIVGFRAVAIAVGVSALVGIVFGLYPARRASRLAPIDALRYE